MDLNVQIQISVNFIYLGHVHVGYTKIADVP